MPLLLAVGLGLGLVAAPAAQAQPRPAGRPTVSVPDFKNTVTQQTWWWQGPVATDLAAMLSNELQATGDIQVVERNNLKAVLSEQELAELGIVRKNANAAQRGQMTGARYIVLGTVSSYESNVESKTSGSNFGLLGFGTNKQQAETKDYVAIDVRVVDSTTGEVVGQRTVEGRASNTAAAQENGVNLLPAAGLALFLAPNMGRTGQGLTGGCRHPALRLQQLRGPAHSGRQGDPRRSDRCLQLCELPAGAQGQLHGQFRGPGAAAA